MNSLTITGIVNNIAVGDLQEEHGLSLSLEFRNRKYLLDTGAGTAFLPNLKKLGMDPADFDLLILSHGHYDHTGGLADFLRYNTKAPIFFGPDFTKKRYHYELGASSRELFIPKVCLRAFEEIDSGRKREIDRFTEIEKDIFLTGPIPRRSFEDSGGPFFLDPKGTIPDLIEDEQSIVVRLGAQNILITGCCHSGLINTIDYCEEQGHLIQIVFGGFHLGSASEDRLRKTADYLNRKRIERIVPVHCTGEKAIGYLKEHFRGIVADFRAGNVVNC
ncbi:MAG: MBL fold metallo-hydrolase [Planctomycetia bacterium]|nr:MBL fold metallo-hydrolase [Planctomycetia bacterium]